MIHDRKTILIVDDTPLDAGIIAASLKDHFKTSVATNGRLALTMARANDKPDLILLDVMMSEMDGYEVCRRLKAGPLTRDIPVIFLTARTDVEDETKGYELGAVDYIHKPFSPPIVLARVTNHVALQSALNTARDLSDRLSRTNEELEARIAAALQREQVKQAELSRVDRIATMGVFTASIAHEISQPLAAIAANSGAAERWLSALQPNIEEARAAVKRIREESHRASHVLNALRSMFTKDNDKKTFVAINDIIKDTLLLLQGQLQKGHVLVQTELLRDLPEIFGDRIQLQQVFMNLMLNAVEAMEAIIDRRRVLQVASNLDDRGRLIVTVEDTGTGIDPKELERIFETFFTTKSGGMGIGLAICRSIVEAHGGRLWARQRTPVGSIFYVELPRPG